MTDEELEARLAELAELERQKELLDMQLFLVKEELRLDMEKKQIDKIQTARYMVSWTKSIRRYFDTKRFQKEHPEAYEAYRAPSETWSFRFKQLEEA